MKVFIDGENMRHRLVQVLLQSGRIHDSEAYFKADIRRLVTDVLKQQPEQINYYTTRIRMPEYDVPERLHEKIVQIQEQHRRWIAELTNQGINVVKAGLLKIRESNACYHCGKRTLFLQEKGVDVRMATEMVMAAVHDRAEAVVVMSSDADMIPALEVVRKAGTKVIYLCFDEEENEAIKQVSDQMITYNHSDILKVFTPYQKQEQNRGN